MSNLSYLMVNAPFTFLGNDAFSMQFSDIIDE